MNIASMYIFLVYSSWCTCRRISLGYLPRTEFLDRRVWKCSNFLDNTKFPKWFYQFIITYSKECSGCSVSLPACDSVQRPNICQPSEYKWAHNWILISTFIILKRVKYLSYILNHLCFLSCFCIFVQFLSGRVSGIFISWTLKKILDNKCVTCYQYLLQFLECFVELTHKLI